MRRPEAAYRLTATFSRMKGKVIAIEVGGATQCAQRQAQLSDRCTPASSASARPGAPHGDDRRDREAGP